VSASYTPTSEVQILISKAVAAGVVDGEQSIYSYSLPAIADSPLPRLKMQVQQVADAILFTTDPCRNDTLVELKIINKRTLCFESQYTEKSQEGASLLTQTITRKEKVSFRVDTFEDSSYKK
jgi:hypothetical protein